MKYIDLTHTFTSDMPVYPGDPKATLEQVAHIESDTFNDHRLTTIMHVGTHMDAPLHMIAGGKKIDELDISNFMGPGVVVDARQKTQIDASLFEGVEIPEGTIVLVLTGLGTSYREPGYFDNAPAFSEDFAHAMVEHKVKIVGMDSSGPDHDQPWPVHKILLGSDILILENLCNLEQLLDVGEFEVVALPAKLAADGAPVRVIATIK